MKWIADNAEVVVSLVIIIVVLVVFGIFKNAECHAKWQDSGAASKWGVMTGCMVQRPNGTWVPSENMRELSQ